MKQQRLEFLQDQLSIITSQATVRGFLARKQIRDKKRAAVMIQSNFRMWSQMKKYSHLRKSVHIIQEYYRSYRKMKQQRLEYLQDRLSIITSQAIVRGFLARKQIKDKKRAAVIIQSNFRMWSQMKKYSHLRKSVHIIQARWKATVLMRKDFLDYHIVCGAILTVQKIWKGRQVRRNIACRNKAATIIQAHVRGMLHLKSYNLIKTNAVVIQQWWRHVQMGLHIRGDFVKRRRAATVIQASVRKHLVQRHVKLLNRAATTIQSSYRSYRQRKSFLKEKECARIIQTWWCGIKKMRLHKEEYQRTRESAITLQAALRGMLARREYNRCLIAAVRIQARVRGWMVERKYKKKKRSVDIIKRWWISVKISQFQQNNYLNQRRAVILLQAHTRGMLTRRNIRKQHKAATMIQSRVRGMIVRKQIRQHSMAAIIIQSHVRCWLGARAYQRRIAAVVKIQRHFRLLLKAREIQGEYQMLRDAAITIQASFRGMVIRKNIIQQRNAQVKIAAFYRGWHTRKLVDLERRSRSAAIIQRWWKAAKLTNEIRSRYILKQKSLVVIQAFASGMIIRKSVTRQRNAALKIQKCFRGWILRKKLINMHISAITIQSYWRCWKVQKNYQRRKESIILIQRRWRAMCSTKKCIAEYMEIRRATITIQSYVRGMLERKNIILQERAAIKIQSFVRRWQLRKNYLRKIKSASIIQHWWRTVLLNRKLKSHQQNRENAAVILQAYCRSWLVRQKLKRQKVAAIVIQSHVRCWSAKCNYKKKMDAIIKLQRYWRSSWIALRTQEDYIYLQRAAVILQATWRGRKARKLYTQMRASRLIQAYFRGWRARRQVAEKRREVFLQHFSKIAKVNLSAITIQRWYRRHKLLSQAQATIGSLVKIQRWVRAILARDSFLKKRRSAIIIQRAWRIRLGHIHKERQQTAASIIQAAWRGRVTRQSLGGQKLEEVRKRLAVATKGATDSKRIGNRTKCAIDYLTKYKDLKRVLIAVMYLDTSTRWSPPCCVKLTEGTALQTLIFILKRSNRSIPHMQIVSYVLNIFINLSKYSYTAQFVHKLDGLFESILQLMTIHYEKGPAIFCKCCTLLYIFAATNPSHEEIYSARVKKDLSGLKALMIRKENASLRGQRAAKYAPLPASQLPTITPDWTLKGGKLREFDNPIPAVVTTLARLEMTN